MAVAQEQRELAPMDGTGVQEAVERIPLKRDGLWRILLPLVEGTPLEHRLERDEEDGHDRKAAQLVGIVCDTVKVLTVIVQNSPSHRGNFPIKSGAS